MPYKTKAIANLILNKAAQSGEKLRPLKLQKLMYYIAGYYVAVKGEPLFDTPIEAWEYGPVVNSIYHEFKEFGAKEITRPAMDVDPSTGSLMPTPIPTDDLRLNKIVDFVWSAYGKFTGLQLSEMTHAEGTPWRKTREKHPGMRGIDINIDLIREHFSPLVKKKAA